MTALLAMMRSTADWPAKALEYVSQLSDAQLTASLFRPEAPAGQWILSLSDQRALECQVLLNYFDHETFRSLWRAKCIVPHDHERDFVTQLLCGNYLHLLFGLSDLGELALEDTRTFKAGDVYGLSHKRRHMIVSPADGTISIAIRGPTLQRNCQQSEGPPQLDDALSIRAKIVGRLSTIEPLRSQTSVTIWL